MDVISKSMDDLVLDPNNARTHNEKNINVIKSSLAKFGQQKPIVINSQNVIIAGNGTYTAAKELGLETISCVVTDLNDFNQSAFAIADNRTAELAEWDDEILNSTLQLLESHDFNISEIGFFEPVDDFKFDPESGRNSNSENESFEIILMFDDDTAMEDMLTEMNDRGIKAKVKK